MESYANAQVSRRRVPSAVPPERSHGPQADHLVRSPAPTQNGKPDQPGLVGFPIAPTR